MQEQNYWPIGWASFSIKDGNAVCHPPGVETYEESLFVKFDIADNSYDKVREKASRR